MYLKVAAKNELEFDLDLQVIAEAKDEVEFLVAKDLADTTYREQPFIYHARLVRLLQRVLDATQSVEFFRLKIKEVFRLKYAFDLMMLDDIYTSRPGATAQVPTGSKTNTLVRMAASYLKTQSVVFFRDVYFNQTVLGTWSMRELETAMASLVQLETMRFSSMGFQTQFISYAAIHQQFDRRLDLYSGYLLHLVHSELFQQNTADPDMHDNYQKIAATGR